MVVAATEGRDGEPDAGAPDEPPTVVVSAGPPPSPTGAAPDPGGPSHDDEPDREPDRESSTPDSANATRIVGTRGGDVAEQGRCPAQWRPNDPAEAPTRSYGVPARSRPDAPEVGSPPAEALRAAQPTAVWPAGAPAAPPAGPWAAPGSAWGAAPGPYPGGRPTAVQPAAPYAYPAPGQYGAPPPGQYGAPPPGQYGAPPPGQYGAPPPWEQSGRPAGEPGAAPSKPKRRRRRTIVALVVTLVLLIAAGGAGYLYYERSTRTVELLAADTPGENPFTPTLVQTGSLVPTVRFDGVGENRTPAGNLDGLYLDSTGSSGCNRAQLDSVLRGDPGLAARWVAPLGIGAPAASEYIAGLTPVRLRADTRLTAHRNPGGQAEPYAATLQAGTAVLVDDRGLPRVRCADGAPLIGAQPLADPVYGTGWDGFDVAKMIEIRPAGVKTVEFGLVDTEGKQPFRRPAGTTGDRDFAALPETGKLDGYYFFTGDQTRCEGLKDCPSAGTLTLVSRFAGCPEACTVTDPELGENVPLTGEAGVLRASGTVPTQHRAGVCDGNDVPYAFSTTFTVGDSQVREGVWTATRVTADHEVRAPRSGGCVSATIAWTVRGVGG